MNKGERSNLYFWKETSGHEVDVLIDEGIRQIPIEIKSGQTINQSWLKGINYWNKLNETTGGYVFFGGDEGQERSNGLSIKSWREIGAY